MNNKIKKFILIIGDIVILYGALYVTLLVRYSQKPSPELWKMHFLPFSIIFILWLMIFYISDLYNLNFAISNRKFYRLSIRSFFVGGLISTLFFYLVPGINITPKTNLLLFVLIFASSFIIWRHFFNWSLKSYMPRENLAIVGYNEQVENLIKELKRKPHLGFCVHFILVPDNEPNKKFIKDNNISIYSNVNELNELIKKNKISTLILASDPIKSEKLSAILFNCLPLKINYINLSHFYENIIGKVPIDIINKIWFLENLSEGSKDLYDMTKRAFEFILSLLILIVTLPLWLIISLVIKIESKGSVFFKQTRVGQNGSNFTIIKFRSMKTIDNNHVPTKKDDSRITKFGSFLRKTRLDEIPQIINVLKGNMSFVGPRPERPELVTKLEKQIPFYKERMLVKPGITGWDQISSEYHSPSYKDTLEKLQYDLFYIKNRSLYLDLSIILRTISTVLSKSGR